MISSMVNLTITKVNICMFKVTYDMYIVQSKSGNISYLKYTRILIDIKNYTWLAQLEFKNDTFTYI